MEKLECLVCGQPAQWVRATQFAGDHPYCEHHAKKEDDFEDEGDSYSYWYEVKHDTGKEGSSEA